MRRVQEEAEQNRCVHTHVHQRIIKFCFKYKSYVNLKRKASNKSFQGELWQHTISKSKSFIKVFILLEWWRSGSTWGTAERTDLTKHWAEWFWVWNTCVVTSECVTNVARACEWRAPLLWTSVSYMKRGAGYLWNQTVHIMPVFKSYLSLCRFHLTFFPFLVSLTLS
jgi:hypothetical protein